MQPNLNPTEAPLTILAEEAPEAAAAWEEAGYETVARGKAATVLLATGVVPQGSEVGEAGEHPAPRAHC